MTDPFAPAEPRVCRRYDPDDIFDWIVAYKREHDGCSPTVREIQEALNISSTSVVNYQLHRLERAGRIRLDESKSRSIMVVGGRWEIESK